MERRTQEIEQERWAGEQLRVMLVQLAEKNRELAGTLVQKAPPPVSDTEAPTPKRIRWYRPFGKR